jgi:hypothetical protein
LKSQRSAPRILCAGAPRSALADLGIQIFQSRVNSRLVRPYSNSLRPKRARGTPGSQKTHGPRHLTMPRHSGSSEPQVRRNLRRPARDVCRPAPQDPRWADFSGLLPLLALRRPTHRCWGFPAPGGRFPLYGTAPMKPRWPTVGEPGPCGLSRRALGVRFAPCSRPPRSCSASRRLMKRPRRSRIYSTSATLTFRTRKHASSGEQDCGSR